MQRTDWIGWAFAAKHAAEERELNAGEKLVLVYLAAQVGADGLARLDREQLAKVTDYEPRSVQRILKSLRDTGLLVVADSGWYGLGASEAAGLPPAELLEVTLTRKVVIDQAAPLLAQEELEAAGETIAQAINDAADRLLVRLNDSSLRLLGGMERLVLTMVADPMNDPPAPDPVLTHPLYQQLLELGIDQDKAYALAEEKLASGEPVPESPADASHARSVRSASPEAPRAAAREQVSTPGAGGAPRLNTARFLETPRARFDFVWNLLHEKPPTDAAAEELFQVWQQLEDQENKHSVAGETVSAFEQLFPAIVAAAEREMGRMPMREFIDLGNANRGAAPWDKPAAGGQLTTSEMDREISRMVQEIERANHPTIQIGPPTTEKDDDTGATRTESTLNYFLRVKRVHQQLLQWRQMTE